ncbi:hypothetical protein ACQP2X_28890 [Actinoplanes sp. CA-131856]
MATGVGRGLRSPVVLAAVAAFVVLAVVVTSAEIRRRRGQRGKGACRTGWARPSSGVSPAEIAPRCWA